jgi:hypothetical protein
MAQLAYVAQDTSRAALVVAPTTTGRPTPIARSED